MYIYISVYICKSLYSYMYVSHMHTFHVKERERERKLTYMYIYISVYICKSLYLYIYVAHVSCYRKRKRERYCIAILSSMEPSPLSYLLTMYRSVFIYIRYSYVHDSCNLG